MKLIMSDSPIDTSLLAGKDITYFDLSALKIAPCVGCFGCWTRTPGKCVVRDDATRIYPCIARSNQVLYISRLRYGGYDTVMKTMLERTIPVQQAFIRIHEGETHHVQRAVALKQATILAYGAQTEEEQDIFRQLVARNARNMSFESHKIVFTTEALLESMVKNVLQQWEKS